MAPAGNLIFVVMIIIMHNVKSTVIMNLNETKIVKKGDEVDLKHSYKPKFINSPNVFNGMNLNEYNVIKIQVQAYPRPKIIQMNVGNAVIKPKVVDGSLDNDEYWIIYNFTMKAEYVGEKHHVRVTNEKGAANHYFMLQSHIIKPESNNKLRPKTQTAQPDMELKPEPELDSEDVLEQKIIYLEKELEKSSKEISFLQNEIKDFESINYGLKLQIPYYEEELKSCQRNRMGKDFKYSIDKNHPFKINIACKNDFTRESNGKFSNVQS